MALNVTISKGSRPAPQIVDPKTVVAKSGAKHALAYTLPKITTDLTGCSFSQRSGVSGNEFSFDHGTMTISLQQKVYIANDLTPCEQRKWAAHERHHVDDNRTIMDQLKSEFMSYGLMQDVFVNGTWYPRGDFTLIQNLILQEVGDAFLALEAIAVTSRDTVAEYRRVAREILRDCPGPIRYVVQSGDTLTGIALHYYGAASKSKRIHDANRSVIGRNPHFIREGQTLVIPK